MSAYHYVMIGYTHIDPVWLWKRAEGLQEVKASFASALDRMEENHIVECDLLEEESSAVKEER